MAPDSPHAHALEHAYTAWAEAHAAHQESFDALVAAHQRDQAGLRPIHPRRPPSETCLAAQDAHQRNRVRLRHAERIASGAEQRLRRAWEGSPWEFYGFIFQERERLVPGLEQRFPAVWRR